MSDGRERDVKRSREDSYKVDSRHYDNPESVLRSTCQFSQTGKSEGKEAWKPRKTHFIRRRSYIEIWYPTGENIQCV